MEIRVDIQGKTYTSFYDRESKDLGWQTDGISWVEPVFPPEAQRYYVCSFRAYTHLLTNYCQALPTNVDTTVATWFASPSSSL